MRIQNTADEGTTTLKVVAYGPPGSGKTTFGATFPKPLVLNAESGLLSVKDKGLDFVAIEQWEDMEEAFAYLRKGDHGYKSVIIDSLTEVQKKLNDYLVRKYPGVRRAYDGLASESDWGANIDKMRRLCRTFRDLPMHVLFITLSQDTVVDGENVTRPALNGKTLPDELCGWCDVVLYMPGPQQDDDGGIYYPGQVVPSRGRRAKIRVPQGIKVPAVITPDFTVLEQLVLGQPVEAARPTSRRMKAAQTEQTEQQEAAA